jgi:hypothetical protein
MQRRTDSPSRTRFVAPVAIVLVALAVAIGLTALVMLGGLDAWMVVVLLGIALVGVLVFAE